MYTRQDSRRERRERARRESMHVQLEELEHQLTRLSMYPQKDGDEPTPQIHNSGDISGRLKLMVGALADSRRSVARSTSGRNLLGRVPSSRSFGGRRSSKVSIPVDVDSFEVAEDAAAVDVEAPASLQDPEASLGGGGGGSGDGVELMAMLPSGLTAALGGGGDSSGAATGEDARPGPQRANSHRRHRRGSREYVNRSFVSLLASDGAERDSEEEAADKTAGVARAAVPAPKAVAAAPPTPTAPTVEKAAEAPPLSPASPAPHAAPSISRLQEQLQQQSSSRVVDTSKLKKRQPTKREQSRKLKRLPSKPKTPARSTPASPASDPPPPPSMGADPVSPSQMARKNRTASM